MKCEVSEFYDEDPIVSVIPRFAISAVALVLNLIVTIKEIKRRCRVHIEFQSPALKWLSLLSIVGGIVHPICYSLSHFGGFCYFIGIMSALSLDLHPICVGLYQLGKLYQSFADSKVHRGYPRSLFVAMTGFAIVYSLFIIPFVCFRV